MEHHIICLIEKQGSQFSATEIGYVETNEDRDMVNSIHRTTFETWFETNIDEIEAGTISVLNYFDSNPPFHECKISTNSLFGRENLSLITNINTLE